MSDSAFDYSVIVPVYGNAPTLGRLLERVRAASEALGGNWECVFVVDGSPDDSAAVLHDQIPRHGLTAQVIVLSRNFGSFAAIRAGLQAARGSYLAVIAADLQEPPEIVVDFFRELRTGDHDIVLGRRVGRADPLGSRLAADLYWRLYRRVVNSEVPEGGVDVFACTRQVAEHINQFTEQHTSLVGLLFWVGFRRGFVDYERREREEGKSGWTFRRKLRYLLDSIYAFTDLPIIVLQVMGMLGVLGSLAIGAVTLAAWSVGAIGVPGYTPLILVMLFATSSILLGLGVVGSYLWRTYENGKLRPIAVVMRTQTFAPADGNWKEERDN